MKGLSLVFILLFLLKVQASFLDDFRGAISNINHGFGKLLGDVVTDVKDTLYCTISAVEQVLVQNGLLDKRTLYNQKCNGIEKPKVQSLDFGDGNRSKTVSQIKKHSVVHHEHSSTRISHESDHSIKNVNKTIINVLDDRNMDLEIAPDILKVEANRLTEISEILKQESEKISENVKNEIKKLQFHNNNKSLVESVVEEFQLLNNLRRNSKNVTEVNEIRRIFDKVTNKMDLKINSQDILDTHDLEELKKELQKYSSNDEKLSPITDKQSLQKTAQDSSKKPTYSKIDVNHETSGDEPRNEHKQKQDIQSNGKLVEPEKSIFSLGLDSLPSFFKSMPVSPDDLNNAKKIVAHSQHSDKVLNTLF